MSATTSASPPSWVTLTLLALLLYTSPSSVAQEKATFDSWLDCEATGNEDPSCQVPVCPDCRLVDCYPELSEADCPRWTVLKEGLAYGGCCPACVTYMGEDEQCQPNSPEIGAETIFSNVHPVPCTEYTGTGSDSGWGQEWAFRNESLVKSGERWVPLISLFDCHPNYSCRCSGPSCSCTVTNTTQGGIEEGYRYVGCEKAWQFFKTWEESEDVTAGFCEEILFEESCSVGDEGRKAVQSKTNKYELKPPQYCVDFWGNTIFGDAEWDDADATCECSRKQWELGTIALQNTDCENFDGDCETRVKGDISLHCDTRGNYEEWQCDEGRCWCVDGKTGAANTNVVAEELARFLPCYSESNGAYQRRCESKRIGRARAVATLERHGHQWATRGYDTRCDYDGSFYRAQCSVDSNTCSCVDKNNVQIGAFGVNENVDYWYPWMGCKCARDYHEGRTEMGCTPQTGNFSEMQQFGNFEFCVDDNGNYLSGKYPLAGPSGLQCEIEKCKERRDECAYDQRLCDKECVGYCTAPPAL